MAWTDERCLGPSSQDIPDDAKKRPAEVTFRSTPSAEPSRSLQRCGRPSKPSTPTRMCPMFVRLWISSTFGEFFFVVMNFCQPHVLFLMKYVDFSWTSLLSCKRLNRETHFKTSKWSISVKIFACVANLTHILKCYFVWPKWIMCLSFGRCVGRWWTSVMERRQPRGTSTERLRRRYCHN